MTISEKFENALQNIPPPGSGIGKGCNPSLLSAANYGVRAGVPESELFQLIQSSIPIGRRKVRDNEIWRAIDRAKKSSHAVNNGGWKTEAHRVTQSKKSTPLFDGKLALKRIIERGRKLGHEADLWHLSPIRMDWKPEEDAIRLLEILYSPDDFLFIGKRYSGSDNVKPVEQWIKILNNVDSLDNYPFIIPNPLSGEWGETDDGKPSKRCDNAVKEFRYCLIEFDNLSYSEQLAFWAGIDLPVVALIHSGGKSVHGWIKVDCADRDEWTSKIRVKLYEQRLTLLGVDTNCKNEARLSRLPGVMRKEKNKLQRMLYLAPEGRAISCRT